jgi:hypothetical protein
MSTIRNANHHSFVCQKETTQELDFNDQKCKPPLFCFSERKQLKNEMSTIRNANHHSFVFQKENNSRMRCQRSEMQTTLLFFRKKTTQELDVNHQKCKPPLFCFSEIKQLKIEMSTIRNANHSFVFQKENNSRMRCQRSEMQTTTLLFFRNKTTQE